MPKDTGGRPFTGVKRSFIAITNRRKIPAILKNFSKSVLGEQREDASRCVLARRSGTLAKFAYSLLLRYGRTKIIAGSAYDNRRFQGDGALYQTFLVACLRARHAEA